MNLHFESFSCIKFVLLLLYLSFQKSCAYSPNPKIKVCVIGAGPSGISVTRYLADNLDNFEISVFEKLSNVGGAWVYTDKTGLDDYGYPIHSSMYQNLRTEAPKEIMNFWDWPEYKGVNQSSVPHYVVLEYLRNYTDHYQLQQFIQFNTIVENVTLQKKNGLDKWKVTIKNIKSSKRMRLLFDAIIVCNGHFFSPYIPKIPGLKNFKGIVLHSHDYRKPEIFKNKSVILLGAGSSGYDIGLDLSRVASKVFLSHNKEKFRGNLTQVKGIDRFENGKFVLRDNMSISADVLLFCTGYNYVFPFLDSSSGIKVDDNYISPLYKHMINVEHPSMSFVGIPKDTNGFEMIHSQAQYVVKYLKGQVKLPSKKVMLEDSKLKTSKKRNAHSLFLINAYDYINELAYFGHFALSPEYYEIGFKAWNFLINEHRDNFKDYNLMIGDDRMSVKVVKP